MNSDDPKFTAHALGEIEDLTATERAEIEALLASDPAALADAEETRALAARLRAELPAEEASALHAEQRAAVFSAATTKSLETKIVRFPLRRLAQIAAVLVVMGLAAAMFLPTFSTVKGPAASSLAAKRLTASPDFAREERPGNLGGLIASNPEPAAAPTDVAKLALPVAKPSDGMTTPNSASATALDTIAVADLAPDRPASSPAPFATPAISDPRATINGTMDPKLYAFKDLPLTAPASSPAKSPMTDKMASRSLPQGVTKALNKDIATASPARVGGWARGGPASSSVAGNGGNPEAAASRLAMMTTPAPAFPVTATTPTNTAGVPASLAKSSGDSWRYRIAPVPMEKSTAPGKDGERADLTASGSGKLTLTPALATTALPKGMADEAARASQLFNAGKYAQAAELYAEMNALEPNNAYVLSNLGVTRFREGKLAAATEAFKKAAELAPGEAHTQTGLGIVYYSQGKYDEAVNTFAKALALDPRNATAHNYLGITASQKGWMEAAGKELEAALQIDPNYADSHFNLAVVLAMQNPPNRAKALWHYRRAMSLGAEPDSALEQIIGQSEPQTAEAFDEMMDNGFLTARENPLSTFSIDVDTASYSIVRRFLNNNQQPPRGAVRIEELLNYFPYDYAQPQGDAPFSAAMEVSACPWTPEHRLVRIALKGREIARDKRPASNLVFLIDVSGSMNPENKLPLLKRSLGLLVDQLGEEDQVAIVVYAGSSGCVLEPTHDRRKMHAALSKLEAGGSTNGGSGVQLAYKLAEKSFIKGGTNRVILATDGDWNVGITNQNELLDLIKRKARSGVFLTVLGVGMDNLKDTMLVKLADTGNGNYAYLDTLLEAKKVLVEQLSGTLVTIAKDVKIQVEFNPAQVGSYRLIGYEKRMLAKEDFNNDKKDAGEIGAGHTVTALYEVAPAGQELIAKKKTVDPLKYQTPPLLADNARAASPKPEGTVEQSAAESAAIAPKADEAGAKSKAEQKPMAAVSKEMLTLKLRYKEPEGDTSKLLEFPLTDHGAPWEQSSRDFRFAAAVAGYGMLLRDSAYKGEATWSAVAEWAAEGKGTDATGYRAEFLGLLDKARAVTR